MANKRLLPLHAQQIDPSATSSDRASALHPSPATTSSATRLSGPSSSPSLERSGLSPHSTPSAAFDSTIIIPVDVPRSVRHTRLNAILTGRHLPRPVDPTPTPTDCPVEEGDPPTQSDHFHRPAMNSDIAIRLKLPSSPKSSPETLSSPQADTRPCPGDLFAHLSPASFDPDISEYFRLLWTHYGGTVQGSSSRSTPSLPITLSMHFSASEKISGLPAGTGSTTVSCQWIVECVRRKAIVPIDEFVKLFPWEAGKRCLSEDEEGSRIGRGVDDHENQHETTSESQDHRRRWWLRRRREPNSTPATRSPSYPSLPTTTTLSTPCPSTPQTGTTLVLSVVEPAKSTLQPLTQIIPSASSTSSSSPCDEFDPTTAESPRAAQRMRKAVRRTVKAPIPRSKIKAYDTPGLIRRLEEVYGPVESEGLEAVHVDMGWIIEIVDDDENEEEDGGDEAQQRGEERESEGDE